MRSFRDCHLSGRSAKLYSMRVTYEMQDSSREEEEPAQTQQECQRNHLSVTLSMEVSHIALLST